MTTTRTRRVHQRFNAVTTCKGKKRGSSEMMRLRKDMARMWGLGRKEGRLEVLADLEEWFLMAMANVPRSQFAGRLAEWIEDERRKE